MSHANSKQIELRNGKARVIDGVLCLLVDGLTVYLDDAEANAVTQLWAEAHGWAIVSAAEAAATGALLAAVVATDDAYTAESCLPPLSHYFYWEAKSHATQKMYKARSLVSKAIKLAEETQ